MAVEINQNDQITHLNEKTQETPSFDEFASLNMDSVNMDSNGDIQVITDDCFIEDDIDKNDCDIMCSVSEPEKIVMTMESYITYGIKTLTSRPDYPAPEFNIRRRYSDFEWLRGKLESRFQSSIIPPIPEKHVVKGVLDRFDKEFIQTRLRALEQFLQRLTADSKISASEELRYFLTLKNFEFNTMKNEDNKIWRKMTKNIKNGFSGLPTVIPPRWQEENRYTERMHDRLTKIERINERMVHEMTSYKDELSALTSELRNWEKEEDEEKSEDLVDSLNTMAIATSKTSDCLTDMIDSTTSKVFPIIREMNKYNLSVLQLLRRRNSLNYQLEKISEALSLKRCDLENLKLNSSFSMINLFSSDPERSRSERSAQLDFEISRYKEEESKLKSKLKIMEAEIEVNLKNYHKMRADQLSDAFRLMAASQTHFHDMAAAAWSQATREQFRQIYEQNKIATEEINDLPL